MPLLRASVRTVATAEHSRFCQCAEAANTIDDGSARRDARGLRTIINRHIKFGDGVLVGQGIGQDLLIKYKAILKALKWCFLKK